MSNKKPKLEVIEPTEAAKVTPIEKPKGSFYEKFKSKRPVNTTGIDTLLDPLPLHSIAQAKDFVRVHHDEDNYWSIELSFVRVPIKGMKRAGSEGMLHTIDEDLARAVRLPSGKILRFRLALAAKPYDIFFLCQIPTTNPDNPWNEGTLRALEQAKDTWVQVTSRRAEGYDLYRIDKARSAEAFPEPKWPKQTLEELIEGAPSPGA